jgi:hypothetical protein
MGTQLENRLTTAIELFHKKIGKSIRDRSVFIPGPNKKRTVNVTTQKAITSLGTICPIGKKADFKSEIVSHFQKLQRWIPLCSSPRAFRTAWNLRSKTLNHFDAEDIISVGGQLLPIIKGSRIFDCIQQGVELGDKKRLILAVRHSEGNYDDNLDDLGRFTYQPPADVTGMVRYRWCQFLSKQLQISYVLLAVMWFEYRVNDDLGHVFIVAPAKIIEPEKHLDDLASNLHQALDLQIINRSEVYSSINIILSLDDTDLETETRAELSQELAREWAYDKISNTEKGRKIKKWAKQTGKKCPGNICNRVAFNSINKLSDINFGHIISQKWAKSFTYMLDKVNHPDNLYLTCKKCNSSLGDNFPDKELRDRIIKNRTIGDLLRGNSDDIRNIR